MALICLCGILLLAEVAQSTSLSERSESGGGCVYSFQLWQPNQDVLTQLRHLEVRSDNISFHLNHELVLLQNRFLQEALQGRNLSRTLEREVTDLKQRQMQTDFALEQLKSGIWKNSPRDAKFFELKNIVMDLKGEWLVIKREVNDLQEVTLQQMEQRKADEVQVKEDLEGLKEGVLKLSGQLQKLRVDRAEGLDMNRMEADLRKLQSKMAQAEGALSSLARHQGVLAQQLLALAMHVTNISRDSLVKNLTLPLLEVDLGRAPRGE